MLFTVVSARFGQLSAGVHGRTGTPNALKPLQVSEVTDAIKCDGGIDGEGSRAAPPLTDRYQAAIRSHSSAQRMQASAHA